MVVECLVVAGAILAGRYLFPSKKARRTAEITFQKLTGTYRDPAMYEVSVTYPGAPVKLYKVRNIKEIPEPDRSTVRNGFRPRHEWLDRFLKEQDAPDGDP